MTAPTHGGDAAAVARGAGTAFLGRAGAVIEAVSQPVFTQLFGLATYGMFIALWSYGRVAAMIADLAMTTALQRFGSAARNEETAHGVLRLALAVSTGLAVLLAALTCALAPVAARWLNVAAEDEAHLPAIIAFYAWSLPLWTFIEVATAAVRARHAFGPEIRVRIFYEQGSRLAFAIGFFFLGWHSYGLFAAHMASLSLAALLSLRLLTRYYDFGMLLRCPLNGDQRREILGFCLAMMPANLAKRLFSDLPPLLLNLMLPGAAGAQAAGLYGIARKIASVVQIVRQSFD
ncbi:MAG: polysaccharide biosynthesis protein, partial [Alphaproteobacteria bacterium]